MIASVSSAADLPKSPSAVSRVQSLQELVQDAIFNDNHLCNVVLQHMNTHPESAPLLARSLSYASSKVLRQRYPVEIHTPKRVFIKPALSQCHLRSHGENIVAGSNGNNLHIIDGESFEFKSALKGHQGAVCRLMSCGHRIVSGADDGTLYVWDAADATLKATLKGYTHWIDYMLLPNGDMISPRSDDGTLLVSGNTSCRPKKVLVGHTGPVSCVITHGEVVVSGGDEICIWNGQTYELQRVIEEGRNRLRCAMSEGNLYAGFPVSSLLSHNGDIIAGSHDGTVSIFDGTAYQLKAVLQSIDAYPLCGVHALIAHKGDIVANHDDGVLRVWEMPSLPYGDNPMALKYALLYKKQERECSF
jgi:WD40 repeat protein